VTENTLQQSFERRISVAPMMDWTDRHCRYFHRLLTRRARLYTEMVTTGALIHGDVPRHLRFNAEELETYKRALALTAGMMTGDYVLSFNEQTRTLRQPFSLSDVFRRMLECLPEPLDNSMRNQSTNQDVRNFVAERHHTDLLFLRLPVQVTQTTTAKDPIVTWREEWLRGGDYFWLDLERGRSARLGSRVQSTQQYLGFVEDLLRTASHIPAWAIAHTENGFISSEEMVEKIGRVRRVSSIYSKDFSDMLGVRASLIVAG